MTKEEWMRMRTGPIPMNVYFDYYRDMRGTISDLSQFVSLFQEALDHQLIAGSDGHTKMVNEETARTKVYEYYEEKFS